METCPPPPVSSLTEEEVEIKICFKNQSDFDKMLNLISKLTKVNQPKTISQINLFFNGTKNELLDSKTILRFRYHSNKSSPSSIKPIEGPKEVSKSLWSKCLQSTGCTATLKQSGTVVDGIARAQETEYEFDSMEEAVLLTLQPSHSTKNPVLQFVDKLFPNVQLECIGGFSNTRRVFPFSFHSEKSLKLEIDTVEYKHGKRFELEVETSQPEKVLEFFNHIFKLASIETFSPKNSKFGEFIHSLKDP